MAVTRLRVGETIVASIERTLTDPTGAVIFEGTGRAAGFEAHGDLDGILAPQTDSYGHGQDARARSVAPSTVETGSNGGGVPNGRRPTRA